MIWSLTQRTVSFLKIVATFSNLYGIKIHFYEMQISTEYGGCNLSFVNKRPPIFSYRRSP